MSYVLIADNDREVSSLLAEVLARQGLQVHHAYDGEEAMVLAREAEVGVLVCDLDMPRASGHEVLESLAELSAPPPAIIVSGYLDEAIEERLRRLPFVRALLRKPFDLLAFSQLVRDLVPATAPGEIDRLEGGGASAEQ